MIWRRKSSRYLMSRGMEMATTRKRKVSKRQTKECLINPHPEKQGKNALVSQLVR